MPQISNSRAARQLAAARKTHGGPARKPTPCRYDQSVIHPSVRAARECGCIRRKKL